MDRRLKQHYNGGSRYTKGVLLVKLVFAQEYTSYRLARKTEYWLKKSKDKDLLKRIIREEKLVKEFK